METDNLEPGDRNGAGRIIGHTKDMAPPRGGGNPDRSRRWISGLLDLDDIPFGKRLTQWERGC
jgi:hypothetical protein